ncbi:SHOCT domain-containing protein [Halorarius litoreus]|uniref:SHOCT domain-containing protein n=1 Tax=Halorarius litoreus TaxID=2962676 RepID=UPI0020CD35DA|nr:SHOCT domain-containing protein [Halorarius litoreus]
MTTTTTDRQLVAAVLVALGAILVIPALLMGFGMMGYGSMMGGTGGPGMWGFGMGEAGTVSGWLVAVGIVLQLLMLAVLVGAGYLIYRAVTGTAGGDRAMEELRLAYARGDLTDEEFESRKAALERDE